MRVRCAGCVLMDGGIALMHRRNVKKQEGTTKPYGEYWVFPGGGLEETDSSKEEGAAREVKEEFGIDIKVEDILIERHIDDLDEYLFKCSYVGGTFGTGTGPEFSGDPKYVPSASVPASGTKYPGILGGRAPCCGCSLR